jgi:hypothetical protein
MENLYPVEPESSTAAKGARQNILDIYITGLKMRYKSIFKYTYGLSFPIWCGKYMNIRIYRAQRDQSWNHNKLYCHRLYYPDYIPTVSEFITSLYKLLIWQGSNEFLVVVDW